MKRNIVFLVKGLVMGVMVLGFLFAIVMPQYSTVYIASFRDKYALLKSIEEPKIIVIGDSNVAFGIDSLKISEQFQMPVVNLGLHGALSQAFHTDMIKEYIGKDDIVVICPAGYAGDAKIENALLAWVTIENSFELWKGINSSNWERMFTAYPTYLKRALKLWITKEGNAQINGPYSRAAFNEWGDVVFPRTASVVSETVYEGNYDFTLLSPLMKQYWNEYNAFVLKNGGRLYMSCAPRIEEKITQEDRVSIELLETSLKQGLEVPIISRMEVIYILGNGFMIHCGISMIKEKKYGHSS
ncbi:hypothetical protein LQZ18_07015 [Lachnospiraceae bacterium ZAX-1]